MRPITKVILFLLVLSFAGCASLINGYNQKLPIISSEKEGIVKIYNDKNELIDKYDHIPKYIWLSRGKGYFEGAGYKIVAEKSGYGSRIIQIKSNFDTAKNVIYNLPFWMTGIVFLDPITGALWELEPGKIEIKFIGTPDSIKAEKSGFIDRPLKEKIEIKNSLGISSITLFGPNIEYEIKTGEYGGAGIQGSYLFFATKEKTSKGFYFDYPAMTQVYYRYYNEGFKNTGLFFHMGLGFDFSPDSIDNGMVYISPSIGYNSRLSNEITVSNAAGFKWSLNDKRILFKDSRISENFSWSVDFCKISFLF